MNACLVFHQIYYCTCTEECISKEKKNTMKSISVIPASGFFCSGGRCVIVSMKPTVVAKVVNPLGTVVTVQSDDETELEVSEDAVIHENCDEALFRPVIASKNIHYAELRTKPQRSDEIFTKSLESTTEVAVKILNKKEPVKINTRNKIQDISSSVNKKTKTRESPPKQKDTKLKDKSTKLDKINNEKENNKRTNTALIGDSNLLCDISDPYNDITDSVKKSESNEDDPILLGNAIKSSKDDFNFYLPPLENDDFFSLENISKGDNFEDARDCTNETFNKENKEFLCSKKEMQENSLIFASEEQPFEEKSLIKKIRKPKTKLGVKIGSVNKENVENTLNTSSLDKETTMPSSKRSWSSIAASKPAEKSLIDSTEKEKEDSLDLPTIESVENFTVTLPKQNYTSCIIMNDLIDINTPQEDKGEALEILPSDSDYTGEDLNLLKISDDEKIDTGSSPAETTTESDDSSKLPKDLAISNGDDDNPSLIKVSQPASKSSKRKLKKKRK